MGKTVLSGKYIFGWIMTHEVKHSIHATFHTTSPQSASLVILGWSQAFDRLVGFGCQTNALITLSSVLCPLSLHSDLERSIYPHINRNRKPPMKLDRLSEIPT